MIGATLFTGATEESADLPAVLSLQSAGDPESRLTVSVPADLIETHEIGVLLVQIASSLDGLVGVEEASRFIANQKTVLEIAKRLIEQEGYPALYQGGAPFNFENALQGVNLKIDDMTKLEGHGLSYQAWPTLYSSIYQISFYQGRLDGCAHKVKL